MNTLDFHSIFQIKMKIQIRQGVFETNSSSVHSLAITTLTVWNKFKNGSLLMKDFPYDISFVDANSVNEKWKVFTLEKFNNGEDYSDYDYMTYEAFEHLDDAEILFEKLNNVLAISVYINE